jgi:phospholipase C
MIKLRIFLFAIMVLATGGALVILSGCGATGGGGGSKPSAPTISKAFGATAISVNGSTSLTFNLANPNAGSSLTGIGFADSLPAGLVVTTPNGLTGSCGGGTITAAAGSGSVSLSAATLSASASCSFSVNVTGTSPGAQNNTTSAVTSNEGGNGQTASASVTVNGAAGKIQHVVIIFQENRSTDNLFQDPVLIKAGADIQNFGIDSNHNMIPLKKITLVTDYDPGHGHPSFLNMCDLNSQGQCQMDGADLVPDACKLGAKDCPGKDLSFGYVDPTVVQPYFQMAEQYTFADRMFQTNQGPSMPAHQFIISGTSAPAVGSNLFSSENPNTHNTVPDAGCDASAGSTVELIDPSGNEKSNAPIFPCFDHPTLTDLLEAKGNTWRYYTSSGYTNGQGIALWVGPEAIQHICGILINGMCGGADWTNHVILDQTQVLTDVTNNQLPDVSWVIPTGEASDHAVSTDGSGPSWVASVVNAIGNSPYWANTAIFITWDDWGGWYDHVAPPQVLQGANCTQWGCGYIYGFRVPLIVVSAYAKAGHISHQQHDFGSILKFVETTFSLPSLGYADAVADDLSDCFDLNQTPIKFRTIAAPLNAEYFLNNKTSHTDPDDD